MRIPTELPLLLVMPLACGIANAADRCSSGTVALDRVHVFSSG